MSFNIWKHGGEWDYALSTAATWVWAPAILVSYSQAYNYGLTGVLWFIVPNVLTLIIFGYVASHFVQENGENVTHAIASAHPYQKSLHRWVSTLLLLCSTTVQLVGIWTIFCSANITEPRYLFITHKWFTVFAIIMVIGVSFMKSGIYSVIMNDRTKYWVVLLCGIALASIAYNQWDFIGLGGIEHPSFWKVGVDFGITASIGLLCAPYVDNTFWQRVFCIRKEKRMRVFVKAAIAFAIIPSLFAFTGFFMPTDYFSASNGIIGCILIVAVLFALAATIDSNLLAMVALWDEEVKKHIKGDHKRHIVIMITLLIAALLCFFCTNLSVTEWFLLYGTARSAIFIPTLLILTKHNHPYLLFLSSIVAITVGSFGYAVSHDYLFTVFAILYPLIAIRTHKEDYIM